MGIELKGQKLFRLNELIIELTKKLYI